MAWRPRSGVNDDALVDCSCAFLIICIAKRIPVGFEPIGWMDVVCNCIACMYSEDHEFKSRIQPEASNAALGQRQYDPG